MTDCTAVRAAFAAYFKTERDRCDRALADIADITCTDKPADEIVDAIMERLERHYGRYGEPGSLAPLGAALADAGLSDGESSDRKSS